MRKHQGSSDPVQELAEHRPELLSMAGCDDTPDFTVVRVPLAELPDCDTICGEGDRRFGPAAIDFLRKHDVTCVLALVDKENPRTFLAMAARMRSRDAERFARLSGGLGGPERFSLRAEISYIRGWSNFESE